MVWITNIVVNLQFVLVEFALMCKWADVFKNMFEVWRNMPVMIWNAFPADSEHFAVRQR